MNAAGIANIRGAIQDGYLTARVASTKEAAAVVVEERRAVGGWQPGRR
jgi:hypothetical protein